MTGRLHGKIALVTGASGGLGGAIAVGYARAGADVACHYRGSAVSARRVADEIAALGRRSHLIGGDVLVDGEAERIVDEAVAVLGGLDVLVNNAGVMDTTPFLDLTAQAWDAVIDTNLRGYFLMGQAAARRMVQAGHGAIVNVSSTRQEQAWPGNAAYAAAKGGVRMLTRVMALELAPLGVRVNAIAPGTIETGLNRHYLADPGFRARRISTIPVGRLGEPQDVVGAAILLASDDASFIVGASLMVDGGQTLA